MRLLNLSVVRLKKISLAGELSASLLVLAFRCHGSFRWCSPLCFVGFGRVCHHSSCGVCHAERECVWRQRPIFRICATAWSSRWPGGGCGLGVGPCYSGGQTGEDSWMVWSQAWKSADQWRKTASRRFERQPSPAGGHEQPRCRAAGRFPKHHQRHSSATLACSRFPPKGPGGQDSL